MPGRFEGLKFSTGLTGERWWVKDEIPVYHLLPSIFYLLFFVTPFNGKTFKETCSCQEYESAPLILLSLNWCSS